LIFETEISLHGTPTYICMSLIPPEAVESLGYIFCLHATGLSYFNFRDELRNTHRLCSRVRYKRSRSSKVVDFGCVSVCGLLTLFRLKAQLIRRTQDLCVEAEDMIETKYDSTYSRIVVINVTKKNI